MKEQDNNYNSDRRRKPHWNLRGAIQTLRKWFEVYCENTSLHGFRHIRFSENVVECGLWFVVCVSAIIFCIILMLRMWSNFSSNPLVTIIDTANPIWKMPFPGVTICNNNKVYKPHAEELAKALSSYGFDSGMNNRLFTSLMKLIRPDRIEIDNATASFALDILGYSVEELMLELMQPCSKLLVRCAWLGKIYDCNKIFKTVKSNEGFCCGFNYHFDETRIYKYKMENSTERKNNAGANNSSEPLPGVDEILKAPGAGRDVGLSVVLNIEGDKYKSSVKPFLGANILIHDPLDFPDIGTLPAAVQPGHVLTLAVTATSIKSEDEVRNIALHKRNCLFDGETPGETQYSYQTCMSECMLNQTYGYCGCLPFFYPGSDTGMRTCYLTDIHCILTRRRNVAQMQSSHGDECNCLPQCIDKMYNLIAEEIRIDDIGYDSELTRGLSIKNTSLVYVFFQEGTYIEYRRQSIMGWDGFLASFGGIFGLCLGGSVISLVELAYHFVTEFLNLRKRKQEQRRNNIPPASKMFLSVQSKDSLLNKYDSIPIEKRVFFVTNDNFHKRGQNNYQQDNQNCFRSRVD